MTAGIIKTRREQIAEALNEASRRAGGRGASLRLAIVLAEAAAHLDDATADDLWRLIR